MILAVHRDDVEVLEITRGDLDQRAVSARLIALAEQAIGVIDREPSGFVIALAAGLVARLLAGLTVVAEAPVVTVLLQVRLDVVQRRLGIAHIVVVKRHDHEVELVAEALEFLAIVGVCRTHGELQLLFGALDVRACALHVILIQRPAGRLHAAVDAQHRILRPGRRRIELAPWPACVLLAC